MQKIFFSKQLKKNRNNSVEAIKKHRFCGAFLFLFSYKFGIKFVFVIDIMFHKMFGVAAVDPSCKFLFGKGVVFKLKCKGNTDCGTVFCNYNGKIKQQTYVGNNVFIGSNVNLVAPLVVEDNAFIAAGSTITNNVPNSALAIARARQTNKPNYFIT